MTNLTGMELVRRDDARRKLAPIEAMIPPSLRGAGQLTPTNFLFMAARQLEGKDFKPESLYAALMTFAQAGLLPNAALGHAYLIPYGRKVTPVFGYKGLLVLARRAQPASGQRLIDVHSDVVIAGDDWDMTDGLRTAVMTHRRQPDRDPRKGLEALIGAYAVFRFAIPLGAAIHDYYVVEWMERGEVMASRESSAAVKGNRTGSPWFTWPLRMAQRAPIRRACMSGRVPLGFLAGSAVAASMQAETGQMAGYLESIRQAAPAGHEGAVGTIIDGAQADDDAGAAEPDASRADATQPAPPQEDDEKTSKLIIGIEETCEHVTDLAHLVKLLPALERLVGHHDEARLKKLYLDAKRRIAGGA